jgi:hypothetical protein
MKYIKSLVFLLLDLKYMVDAACSLRSCRFEYNKQIVTSPIAPYKYYEPNNSIITKNLNPNLVYAGVWDSSLNNCCQMCLNDLECKSFLFIQNGSSLMKMFMQINTSFSAISLTDLDSSCFMYKKIYGVDIANKDLFDYVGADFGYIS